MHEEIASSLLLDWYDANARSLPWRVKGGEADPYRVWLSEIMLQQTTVKAVIPYFETFTSLWPDVRSLAKATDDEVMARWAGLGYYSRARNLIACARMIAADGGHFPDTEKELLDLPGVGPYTAAAIASIAFGQSATVVDGNVERVLSRLFAIDVPLPKARPAIRKHAETLTPLERAGDYAQAVMDLGATVCTPKSPKCDICPLSSKCAARMNDTAAAYPKREPKKKIPTRRGTVYWLAMGDHILVNRRAPKGLLGGTLEFPNSGWDGDCGLDQTYDWSDSLGDVKHTFSHFHLVLDVRMAIARDGDNPPMGEWKKTDALEGAGFSSLMEKVRKLVMAD